MWSSRVLRLRSNMALILYKLYGINELWREPHRGRLVWFVFEPKPPLTITFIKYQSSNKGSGPLTGKTVYSLYECPPETLSYSHWTPVLWDHSKVCWLAPSRPWAKINTGQKQPLLFEGKKNQIIPDRSKLKGQNSANRTEPHFKSNSIDSTKEKHEKTLEIQPRRINQIANNNKCAFLLKSLFQVHVQLWQKGNKT